MPRFYKDDEARKIVMGAKDLAVEAMPYTAALVERFNYIEVPNEVIDTMAVDQYGNLFYSADFVMGRNPRLKLPNGLQDIAVVILHEMAHILFDHATRRGNRDHYLWNLAGDAEINMNLRRVEVLLRDEVIVLAIMRWAIFPDSEGIGMPDGLTAETYYDALMQSRQNQQPPPPPPPGGNGQDGDGDSDDGDDGDGEGTDGGGNGNGESKKGPQVFKPGDRVVVTDGPHKGQPGVVTKASEPDANGRQVVEVVPDLSAGATALRGLIVQRMAAAGQPSGTPIPTGGVTLNNESLAPAPGDDGDGDGNGDGDDGDGEPGQGESGGTTVGNGDCGGGAGGDPTGTDAAREWVQGEYGMLPPQYDEGDWEEARGEFAENADDWKQHWEEAGVLDTEGGPGMGSGHGGMFRKAEEIQSAEELNWADYIKDAISSRMKPGMKDVSRRKIGRRSFSRTKRGTVTPRVLFPGRVSPQDEGDVLFIVDTSGSVGRTGLGVVLREAQGALTDKAVREVHLMAVDSVATDAERVIGPDHAETLLKGGGGTDMRVGIRKAEKMEPVPKLAMLFTDGGTMWPKDGTTLENLVVVIIPMGAATRPESALLQQAKKWGEQWNVPVIGLDLTDYAGPSV